MKKGIVLVLMSLLVGVWGVACGGGTKVIVVESGPVVLLPGEYVESVDANIDMVKCQGKGADLDRAIVNARKGCLEWMITEKLAQAPDERRAYMANQKAVMAKLDRYVAAVKPGARAGKGMGVKSRTRNNDGTINVEINTKVFKKPLMADLVELNIIASKDEMLDKVGRPTLLTAPFKASKGSKYRGMMEGLINSYLTKSKWEVVSAKGVADLDKMVDAIGEVSEAEEDEAAKIAMAAGADVYMMYEAKKEKPTGGGQEVAYSVRVEAYETTTSRMLASEKKTGPARVTWRAGEESRALEEPLRDAMGSILPQVTDYWKEDAPKGRRFYVVFKNTPKKTDMKMNSVLKKACSRVKLIRSTASEATFQVQCKMDNLELAGVIDEGIEGKMSGAEYDFAAKNRSNIIVVFK